MKKSEMYGAAQVAVLNCPLLGCKQKLEIIRRLQKDEEVALFMEEEKEKEEKGKGEETDESA